MRRGKAEEPVAGEQLAVWEWDRFPTPTFLGSAGDEEGAFSDSLIFN
jgi:hypothetical protein